MNTSFSKKYRPPTQPFSSTKAPSSPANSSVPDPKNIDQDPCFPEGLLNPEREENDPKYYRLLAAIHGLSEFERFFDTGKGGDKDKEEFSEDQKKNEDFEKGE